MAIDLMTLLGSAALIESLLQEFYKFDHLEKI